MMTALTRGNTMAWFPRGFALAALLAFLLSGNPARADEAFARTRDYDLEHSKISLRFSTEERKVTGDVIHTLSILRDRTEKISFDSAGLTIHSVTVNKSAARFLTPADKLVVLLPAAARAGERFEVEIRYEGTPSRGLFFVLPDADYPDRPKQIWTQGESEDTRAYLPTYDYPNDRLTTETILTVPASWTTVANGKLMGVTDAGAGMKTWTWKESVPSSTYLTTVVAGEFDELKETWRGIPVTYYAPKGRGDRLKPNYGNTPAMLELFSRKFGVDYPWEKYAQVMVDDFVAGGMENSSATTNNSASLEHPKITAESYTGQDDLISHELGHQWFGDLVTCKDWGHVWLNEGFATFSETVWTEAHFGRDQADYTRWSGARDWSSEPELYARPIVRHDFVDSEEFDSNVYGKGGLVLEMLRHQLGEEAFYRGIKHYLEANRGKNVVTADFARAMEEATHVNIDRFLNQWVYGAGAPKFDLAYTYDDAKHQVSLTVKQVQKHEARVGTFQVPVDVEIVTSSGAKSHAIEVTRDSETFLFPADSLPLLVLFDKGNHLLKTAVFHKEKKEWLYQLKNASDVSDRADAAVALAKLKNDEDAVAALGESLRADKAWGVRATAADSLGQLGGASAAKLLLAALDYADEPWLRNRVVWALGSFKDDAAVVARLEALAGNDKSLRARAAALQGVGRIKSPGAFAVLSAAVQSDSPDGYIRNAALRSLGFLGDDKAVATLLEWSAPGKPFDARRSAIVALSRLQKDNHEVTAKLVSYLDEPYFPIRMSALRAVGSRGDASAIPALEALLGRKDLSILVAPTIKEQIARLKKPPAGKEDETGEAENSGAESGDTSAIARRLDSLEHLIQEINTRLKSIEERLPAKK